MNNHPIKQEIEAADKTINNKDFQTIGDFYTKDAVLVVKPGLLAQGRSKIRGAFLKISDYFNGSLEASQGEMVIIEAGNIALVLSQTLVESPLKNDSEYSKERKAIYVYVKDNTGKWLCAIDNSYGVELLDKNA